MKQFIGFIAIILLIVLAVKGASGRISTNGLMAGIIVSMILLMIVTILHNKDMELLKEAEEEYENRFSYKITLDDNSKIIVNKIVREQEFIKIGDTLIPESRIIKIKKIIKKNEKGE